MGVVRGGESATGGIFDIDCKVSFLSDLQRRFQIPGTSQVLCLWALRCSMRCSLLFNRNRLLICTAACAAAAQGPCYPNWSLYQPQCVSVSLPRCPRTSFAQITSLVLWVTEVYRCNGLWALHCSLLF